MTKNYNIMTSPNDLKQTITNRVVVYILFCIKINFSVNLNGTITRNTPLFYKSVGSENVGNQKPAGESIRKIFQNFLDFLKTGKRENSQFTLYKNNKKNLTYFDILTRYICLDILT